MFNFFEFIEKSLSLTAEEARKIPGNENHVCYNAPMACDACALKWAEMHEQEIETIEQGE